MSKKLRTVLPMRELPEEFRISTELADFPVSDCPSYLREGIGAVCISGTVTIHVFDERFRITPGIVVTLLPWQLVSIKNVSADFRMAFFCVGLTLFTDILSGLYRLRPGFFAYMRRHIASEPDESYIARFKHFCGLLAFWNDNAPPVCRRETIVQFLRTYYWTVYTVYISDPAAEKTRYTHKEETAFLFMHYIVEEHSPDKDVAYYARKLGLTPKSLTNLIRSVSGQSAHDWIVYYTIFEIKALLRDSSLDIKVITIRMHFPDQATLSRYFRRYTGMTPSKYRESFFF
jgi:AraC-like DNA-binding protein